MYEFNTNVKKKSVKDKEISLSHIESRPSKVEKGCYEILVECAEDSDKGRIEEVIKLFKQKAKTIHVHDFNSHVKQNKGISFPLSFIFRLFILFQNQFHGFQ